MTETAKDNRVNNLPRILICDDSVAVHESIAAYLKTENMEYDSAYDGEEALRKAAFGRYDLIILDIMLPKIMGTDVCREIRKKSDVPILILSARGEEVDRILGLEIGADDYVTKPFSPREIVARIRTILKRARPRSEAGTIVFHEMTIDPNAYTVTVCGNKLDMTARQVDLLKCLAENAGRVLSREQLLNQVWGYDYYGDTRVVDTQIKRIRQKLPTEGVGFEIESIYGVGYKLEEKT
jgi:DNA-binding response OmpR family regulator